MPTSQTQHDLRSILQRIDGRGYKAYKDIAGSYRFDLSQRNDSTLFIDYVQGDPFAGPSRLRLRVPQRSARLPEELFQSRVLRFRLRGQRGQFNPAALFLGDAHMGIGRQPIVEPLQCGSNAVAEVRGAEESYQWTQAQLFQVSFERLRSASPIMY